MTGIGIIIIVVQLGPALGQPSPDGSILEKLLLSPRMLSSEPNVAAILLFAFVLTTLVLAPARLARLIPPTLLVLFVGTFVVQMLTVDVPLIGNIPTGIPKILVPDIDIADIPYIVRFGLILAFLGSIDALLTSIVADSMTRTHHNSNRELIGQGIGNVTAGLFGGLASSGATMRTLVNLRAGGKTRLSGAIHSIILLAIVLGFGGMVSYIPIPVLAAILVKVGIDIIDWQYLKQVQSLPKSDLVIMLITLLLTVLVDLITAVVAGFVMASVMYVAQSAESQLKNTRFVFGADDFDDLTPKEHEIMEEYQGRLVLFHVEGPLSFGSARDVAKLLGSDIEKDVLVIDMRHVPFIDSSACTAISEVISRLQEDGDSVLMFGLRNPVREMLLKSGALADLDKSHIINNRTEALKLALSIIEDNEKAVEG